MKLSDHPTESVCRRYAIADSAALEEGVGKLASLHAGRASASRLVAIDEAKQA